ncbi:hypothetical protein E2C01_089036 [Portunus trituberculatus]|uniref:Uncharacterized protein n=1 Tax=Portunus trituberculatus TaxID=210409 RepID=A0A5B7J7S4_PORTR|nr:hypothetical protein [Portunus trituberculatus]
MTTSPRLLRRHLLTHAQREMSGSDNGVLPSYSKKRTNRTTGANSEYLDTC